MFVNSYVFSRNQEVAPYLQTDQLKRKWRILLKKSVFQSTVNKITLIFYSERNVDGEATDHHQVRRGWRRSRSGWRSGSSAETDPAAPGTGGGTGSEDPSPWDEEAQRPEPPDRLPSRGPGRGPAPPAGGGAKQTFHFWLKMALTSVCVCFCVCVSPWTEQTVVSLRGIEGSSIRWLDSAASAQRSGRDCWAPETHWTRTQA